MTRPNFAKTLKRRYFSLFGLFLTFVYNILKGNNWAEIIFNEVIVACFICGVFEMEQLCKVKEKDVIPGGEDVKLEKCSHISDNEAGEFYKKLKSSPIEKENEPIFILIKNEINNKLSQ